MKTQEMLTSLLCLIALLLFTHAVLFAQAPEPEYRPDLSNLPPGLKSYFEPEDPPAILDLGLGDFNVDLLLAGAWTSQLGASFGVSLIPNEGGELAALPYTFPGLEPIPFKNTVDLLLSLWIDEGFFIEADAADEFSEITFLLGFSSFEPDFWLRRVWIGNQGIGVLGNPILQALAPIKGAPGITAAVRTNISQHQLFIRLDGQEKLTRYFIGTQEVERRSINPRQPVSGFSFLLPWNFPESVKNSFSLYIEVSEEGDTSIQDQFGHWYESLEAGRDYILQPDQGRLFIKNPKPENRILVVMPPYLPEYNDLPIAGLSPTDAQDGSFRLDPENAISIPTDPISELELFAERLDQMELNPQSDPSSWPGVARLLPEFPKDSGQKAILLFDPHRFSPLMDHSYYLSGVQDQPVSTLVSSLNSGTIGQGTYTPGALSGGGVYSVQTQVFPSGLIQVLTTSYATEAPVQRLPLIGIERNASGIDPYLSFPDNSPGKITVFVPLGEDTGGIQFSESTWRGALNILRNGIPTQNFSIDVLTGELTFFPPLSNSEQITISLPTQNPLANFTNLTIGTQHDITFFADAFKATLGIATNIPVTEDSTEVLSTMSDIDRSLGVRGQLDATLTQPWIDASLSIQSGIRNLDRFGGVAVFSANSSTTQIMKELHRHLPLTILKPEWLNPAPETPVELSTETMGRLIYRDSYQAGSVRNLPLPYDDPLLSQESTLYDGDSEIIIPWGPYPVRGTGATDSLISGYGHMIEARFAAGQTWAGFTIPISRNITDANQASIPITETPIPSGLQGTIATPDNSGIENTMELYLLVGRPNEDINGNQRLDQSYPLTTQYQGGLQGTLSGIDWQRAYQANLSDLKPTEDLNQNGLIDTFTPETGQVSYIGTLSPGSSTLHTIDIDLQPRLAQDISQGEMAISIILLNPSETDQTVRIISGDWKLLYQGWPLYQQHPNSVFQMDLNDPGFDPVPSLPNTGDWGSAYPQGGRQFVWEHSTITSWHTGVHLPKVPEVNYGNLSLSFYLHTLSGGEAYLRLSGDTLGVQKDLLVPFSLPQSIGWYRVDIDLQSRTWELVDSQEQVLQSGSLPDSGPSIFSGLSFGVSNSLLGRITIGQAWFSSPSTQANLITEGSVSLIFTNIGISASLWTDWTSGQTILEASGTTGLLGITSNLGISAYRPSYQDTLNLTRASHGIGIPLLGFLQLNHTYAQGLTFDDPWNHLDNSLILTFLPASSKLTLNISTLHEEKLGLLTRNWQTGIGVTGVTTGSDKNPAMVHLSLAHSQSHQVGEKSIISENYFSTIVNTFEYLPPWVISELDGRSYTGNLKLSTGRLDAGYQLSDNHSLLQQSPRSVSATQTLTAHIIQNQNIHFSLQYSRKSASMWSATPFKSPVDDLVSLGTLISTTPLIAGDIPIWDILIPLKNRAELVPNHDLLAATSYDLQPQIRLDFTRNPQGRLTDLYIPSVGIAGISRKSVPEKDELAIIGAIGMNAINIFGRQGVSGIGSSFDSDAIGFRANFSGVIPRSHWFFSTLLTWELIGIGDKKGLNQRLPQNTWIYPASPLGFPISGRLTPNTFGADALLGVSKNESGGIISGLTGRYTWNTDLPPMPENIKVLTQKQDWLLIHQISADLEANFNTLGLSGSPLDSTVPPDTNSPVDISSPKQTWQESVFFQVPLVYYDSFSVILKHSSIIILPEIGSLRAFLGLGWRVYESERFDGVLAHQFGGHIGIELQLRL